MRSVFEHVKAVEAALLHTYQLVAYAAATQEHPEKAAALWQGMSELCNRALVTLKGLKETYSECGTPELYDLALDYKNAADGRFYQNLQDAECLKTPPPDRLFPSRS